MFCVPGSQQVSMVEDEAILFSVALYSPPKTARRLDGTVIGDVGFAREEHLTLEDRHQRACRLVSCVHRYVRLSIYPSVRLSDFL